jgi:hypothetical protein
MIRVRGWPFSDPAAPPDPPGSNYNTGYGPWMHNDEAAAPGGSPANDLTSKWVYLVHGPATPQAVVAQINVVAAPAVRMRFAGYNATMSLYGSGGPTEPYTWGDSNGHNGEWSPWLDMPPAADLEVYILVMAGFGDSFYRVEVQQ